MAAQRTRMRIARAATKGSKGLTKGDGRRMPGRLRPLGGRRCRAAVSVGPRRATVARLGRCHCHGPALGQGSVAVAIDSLLRKRGTGVEKWIYGKQVRQGGCCPMSRSCGPAVSPADLKGAECGFDLDRVCHLGLSDAPILKVDRNLQKAKAELLGEIGHLHLKDIAA